MRIFVTALLWAVIATSSAFSQPIQFDSSRVRLGLRPTGDTTRVELAFTNTSNRNIRLRNVRVTDTVFRVRLLQRELAPGAQGRLELAYAPVHNVTHAAQLFLNIDQAPGSIALSIRGTGTYQESYYADTRNKYDEALKQALKTIVQRGVLQLGYNTARDRMYMQIDNQRVNGRGAAQNTIECAYTGEKKIGYTDRRDAQSGNPVFNTEHTFPQSKYDSDEPMRSDLHHLFPTRDFVNSERSNHPFANVSNPNFNAGGSRSNGRAFEPRDVQKGASARAMMYFVVRYPDYDNFYAGQESVLLSWHEQFPPTAVERQRNEDIFRFQKNRNPFIDHPEFMDRISTLSGNSARPARRRLAVSADTLDLGAIPPNSSIRCTLYVFPNGNQSVVFSNFSTRGEGLSFDNEPSFLEPTDGLTPISILLETGAIGSFSGNISFRTTAVDAREVSIPVRAEVTNQVGLPQPDQTREAAQCHYGSGGNLYCHWTGAQGDVSWSVYNALGQELEVDARPLSSNRVMWGSDALYPTQGMLIIRARTTERRVSLPVFR